jgi:class 6 POU domain transcription factor
MNTSCTSTNYSMNPFFSTLFPNLTSQQQQQQQLFTQLLLSGASCPPLLSYNNNPLANALQLLLNNSALFFQQQNFPLSPIPTLIDNNKIQELLNKESISTRTISPTKSIDYSSSDSNDKSTLDDDDNSPTIATTLAALPMNNNDTMISTTTATTIDGINLEEIKHFAKAFKLRRLALGLTQTQVGQALSVTRGPAYSQSAICRFEKLDITPKSASKIKPVLEKWMHEAELKYGDRLKNGPSNLHELVTDLNTKKRKRRTSFTPQALERLNDAFELNTHPSGVDMSTLAQQLNYDREVIRVWFCNKRQALKNSAKKFKTNQINEDNESTTSSLMENQYLDTINHLNE